MKDKTFQTEEVYRRYHTPGCNTYMRRPKNSIFISPSNGLNHELSKLKICYELQNLGVPFITEACRNTKDKLGKIRRVDIVNLNNGTEYEIETDMRRALRFLNDKNVIIIPCGWKKTDKKWIEIVEKKKKH